MGRNYTKKQFPIKAINEFNASWTAPAGVFQVQANVYLKRNKLITCGSSNDLPLGTGLWGNSMILGSASGRFPNVASVGSNSNGQLGLGSDAPVTNISSFTDVAIYPNVIANTRGVDPVDISCSGANSYIVLADGRVLGSGGFRTSPTTYTGELGRIETVGSDSVSVIARSFGEIPQIKKIVQVSAGHKFALFLNSVGFVYSMGKNNKRQLGLQDIADGIIVEPTELSFPDGSGVIVKIAAGARHGLALDDKGDIYEWGDLDTVVGTPRQVGSGKKWTDIAAGFSHSLAIDDSGNVYGWGKNDFGQVGDDSVINANYRTTPVKCKTTALFKSVGSRLGNASIAVSVDGELYGWGKKTWEAGTSSFPAPITSGSLGGLGIEAKFDYAEVSESGAIAVTVSGVVLISNSVTSNTNVSYLPDSNQLLTSRTIQVVPGTAYPIFSILPTIEDSVYSTTPSGIGFGSIALGDYQGFNKILELEYFQ